MMRNLIFIVLYLLTHLFSSAYAKECVAHRGFSGKYLENSMEAFEKAFEAGAKYIEFDV